MLSLKDLFSPSNLWSAFQYLFPAAVAAMSAWLSWLKGLPPSVSLGLALIAAACVVIILDAARKWLDRRNLHLQRIAELEEQLRPRITLDFSPHDIACVHQIAAEPRKIFRVRLVNIGGKPLFCSAYLNRVIYNDENPGLTSPLPLTIAPAEDGKAALRRLIPPTIEYFLDVGLVGAISPNRFFPATEMVHGSRAYRRVEGDLFTQPGDYKLEIAVAPDEGNVATISLLLKLTDDWRTTEIICLGDTRTRKDEAASASSKPKHSPAIAERSTALWS